MVLAFKRRSAYHVAGTESQHPKIQDCRVGGQCGHGAGEFKQNPEAGSDVPRKDHHDEQGIGGEECRMPSDGL